MTLNWLIAMACCAYLMTLVYLLWPRRIPSHPLSRSVRKLPRRQLLLWIEGVWNDRRDLQIEVEELREYKRNREK